MTLTEFKKHFNVSRETISSLTLYESLLKKWNQKTNLVSKNSLDDAWSRHFLDSAQLVKHCQPENKLWLDFGSGAGFPGVVSAVILRDRGINTNFVLVEKNKTKAFFLGELKRRLDLSLDIICENIKEIDPLKADIISARAFSHLENLLPVSNYHGKENSVSLFLKGKNIRNELDKTFKMWFFQYDIISSISSTDGKIIKINKLHKL